MANGGDRVQVIAPDGKSGTIPKSQLAAAQLKGYKTPPAPAATAPKVEAPKGSAASRAASGFTESYGMPANIKDWPAALAEITKPSPYDPTGGPLTTALRMGKGIINAHKETAARELEEAHNAKDIYSKAGAYFKYIESGIPIIGPGLVKAGEDIQRGDVARGLGATAGIASQLVGGEAIKPEAGFKPVDLQAATEQSTKGARSVLASIVNEGATREKMERLQEHDALGTKAKIAAQSNAIKADASGIFDQVSKTVGEKMPQGAINGQDVADQVKADLPQYVKAKTLRTKLPPALNKIIDEAEGVQKGQKIARALTNQELQSVSVMAKQGLRGNDLSSALTNLGYLPAQVKAMMKSVGEKATGDLWEFERGKQLRTELGDEIFSSRFKDYPGPVRAVTVKAYDALTKQLDGAAEKAGVGDLWANGKNKFANYYQDWGGKWENGKFIQSPLKAALQGDNASDIMEALTGKNAQKVRDILTKYKDFGLDPKDIIRDSRRYKANEFVKRIASPSKWDIIIGGMSLYRPEYGIPAFFARYALPRMVEGVIARRAKGIGSTARSITPISPESGVVPPPIP